MALLRGAIARLWIGYFTHSGVSSNYDYADYVQRHKYNTLQYKSRYSVTQFTPPDATGRDSFVASGRTV